MDKLINYIEFRAKKYGVIFGIASVSSMYYQIGKYKVRVSDHIKYGEESIKDCDFHFIIQPNDTYVFLTSPNYAKDGKGYMKIVSYEEAKAFIKSLDDYMIQFMHITDWYIPENWNRKITGKKMSWTEFEKTHLNGKTNEIKLSILDRMDSYVYGTTRKGNLEVKYKNAEETYNNMTISQYNALMAKI